MKGKKEHKKGREGHPRSLTGNIMLQAASRALPYVYKLIDRIDSIDGIDSIDTTQEGKS